MYLNLQLKGDSLVYLASAWEGLEKKRSYLAFVLEGLGKGQHQPIVTHLDILEAVGGPGGCREEKKDQKRQKGARSQSGSTPH